MKTLNNLLLITGFAFGINNYASAQSDTIFSSKTSSIIEEKTKTKGNKKAENSKIGLNKDSIFLIFLL